MDPRTHLYQQWIKPTLFRRDPEAIHHTTLSALAQIGRSPTLCDLVQDLMDVPPLPTKALDQSFPNPIGLAAGMDKNGVAIPAWTALGFGFCEIGGVTRYPQPGNPQPRLFRAPETEAIINRMGFNNHGADAIHEDLKHVHIPPHTPLGINLGKSKRTELDLAHEDFLYSFETLWSVGDFFVVNVSSPNTPGLRELQDRDSLSTILQTLVQANQRLASENDSIVQEKPILVKIAPDLSFSAIDDVIELALQFNLAGIVATNTTIARPQSADQKPPAAYQETGGLSGKPLREPSTAIIQHIAKQTSGKLTLIGVGGIHNAESAWEKISAGAALCQIYSGLVYYGPGLIRSLVTGIADQLIRHGFNSLTEAVGSQCPFISD